MINNEKNNLFSLLKTGDFGDKEKSDVKAFFMWV